MYKLLKLFSIPILCCLTACATGPWFDTDSEGWPIPPGIEDINSAEMTKVIQDLSVEFKHGRHLELQHAKTFFNSGIHTVQLEFVSQDIVEICEARAIIVDLTESFLAKLNQDPLLGTEFSNYPFRSSNLEIYITFESYFGRYVDPYYIHWVGLEDDEVTFYTFDVDDKTKMCWHKRIEAYETVREIVLYQREAEKLYRETHAPKTAIFGNQRYYPKEE